MADLTYPELVKQIMPLFIDESEIPLKELHLLIDRAFKKFTSNNLYFRLRYFKEAALMTM